MSGGKTSVSCLLCDKKLVVKDISHHVHTHIQYFPQKCNDCDFECTQRNALDEHTFETDHSGSQSIDLYKQWLVETINDDIQFTAKNGKEELLKKKNIISLASPTSSLSDTTHVLIKSENDRFEESPSDEVSVHSPEVVSPHQPSNRPVIDKIENLSISPTSPSESKNEEGLDLIASNEMLEPTYVAEDYVPMEDGVFSDIEEEEEDRVEISIPPPDILSSTTSTYVSGDGKVKSDEIEREKESAKKSVDDSISSGNVSSLSETDGIVEPPLKKSKSTTSGQNSNTFFASTPMEKKEDISCVIGVKPPVYPPDSIVRGGSTVAEVEKRSGSVLSTQSKSTPKTPSLIPRRESVRNAMRISQIDVSKQTVKLTPNTDEESEESSDDGSEKEPEEKAEEDWLWLISCICGQTKNDGEPMVQCDKCQLRWEHVECVFPTTKKAPSGFYVCHSCKPRPTELTPEEARAYQERIREQKERKKELVMKRKEARRIKIEEKKKKKRTTNVPLNADGGSTADEGEGEDTEETEENTDDEKEREEKPPMRGTRNVKSEEKDEEEEEKFAMPILTATRGTFRFTFEKEEEERYGMPVLFAVKKEDEA